MGNLSAARRLFRSSLNINSQSYITWMTWASLEEDQGNSVRAEEIRELYFQQRTEVVDDPSWVMGLMDIIDPAIDSIKRVLNMDQNSYYKVQESQITQKNDNDINGESPGLSLEGNADSNRESGSSFDLDAFVRGKLSLDPSKLDNLMEMTQKFVPPKIRSGRDVYIPQRRTTT